MRFAVETRRGRHPIPLQSICYSSVMTTLKTPGACRFPVPSPNVGKPVNVTNGNMWLEQTDYSLPGIGEPIELNRFYNSTIQTSGLFGFGWSTKYDEPLQIYPTTR